MLTRHLRSLDESRIGNRFCNCLAANAARCCSGAAIDLESAILSA
jgi:hypothetical protein